MGVGRLQEVRLANSGNQKSCTLSAERPAGGTKRSMERNVGGMAASLCGDGAVHNGDLLPHPGSGCRFQASKPGRGMSNAYSEDSSKEDMVRYGKRSMRVREAQARGAVRGRARVGSQIGNGVTEHSTFMY